VWYHGIAATLSGNRNSSGLQAAVKVAFAHDESFNGDVVVKRYASKRLIAMPVLKV
jgi:hypothetical protein